MKCTKCGEENAKSNSFCAKCGASLKVTESPQADKQVATSTSGAKKQAPWHLFIIVLLFFAVLTIGAVCVLAIIFVPRIIENLDEFSETSSPLYTVEDVLYAMEPSIQPVGYYPDADSYASGDIYDPEWASKIVYTLPETKDAKDSANALFPNQVSIYETVAKIVCMADGTPYIGSGTNMDSQGYVLTNLHVVDLGGDVDCAIGLPDPETGVIREAYWATPIIDVENTTGHDLAIVSIEEPIFDQNGNTYGFHEKYLKARFPVYEETQACLAVAPELGDRLFVIGYPVLSGGALTVTDGLISSLFSSEGYLITSAKINSGNSGGLAIDSDGCFVGVPRAYYYQGREENYGEVIDAYYAYEFIEAVLDDIRVYSGEEVAEQE